jgi:hypothetical protein
VTGLALRDDRPVAAGAGACGSCGVVGGALVARPDPVRDGEQLRLCAGCAERVDAMPKRERARREPAQVLGGYCDACGVSRPGGRLVIVVNQTGKGPDHLKVCASCEDRVRALPAAPARPPTLDQVARQLAQLQAAGADRVGLPAGSVTPVGRR